ncbi:MAG: IreB family regulatory phosphoprotein [Clostridia bacterium]|nr:IreB family regulatory phosphoprotein [Clostridia bacterium]
MSDRKDSAEDILMSVFAALKAKGYDPIYQIVGYLITGDPTYITNFQDARSLVRRLERDELLEELVQFYMNAREG